MSKRRNEAKKARMESLAQKENGWIKFVRFLIYVISIIGATVGVSLIKTGELSVAYANGTHVAEVNNGEVVLLVSLIILCGNIVWGILRWFLRGYREKWKPGVLVGKLIGGGVWRALLISMLVLFSLLIIAPKISNIIAAKVIEDESCWVGVSLDASLERLEYINKHKEEYDIDELKQELGELLLVNVKFGLDASQNASIKQSSGFLTQNVSAYSSDVKVLNKTVLSSKSNFVVFYTDTGDDAITEMKARELAEMLEMIIRGYEEELGLEYKYQKIGTREQFEGNKMDTVLTNSGIDTNITGTAMPVYVVNPYKDGSDVLATYAGRRFAEVGTEILVFLAGAVGEETAMFYNSTPSYPFINILPENVGSESLAIVMAHELGHHYVSNYNYDKYGGIGSDDDFIGETAPSWMAINVLPELHINNVINSSHYNYNYLKRATAVKISGAAPDFLGYPAVAFLENYYDIVPDAKTKIMDAVYYGDALNYLYEKAGAGAFKKVMSTLAEKNLTGDYGGKLMNYTLPKGEDLECNDLCNKRYSIEPASTEYLYFTTNEYRNTKVVFDGSNDLAVSVLGVGKGPYDTWRVIQSGDKKTEFKFTDEITRNYSVIALAVANASIDSAETYEVGIIGDEFERLVDAVGGFDFGNIYEDLGQGCFEVNLGSLFDVFGQSMELGSAIMGVISRVDGTDKYFRIQRGWDEEADVFKKEIEEAKQNIAGYEISICTNYVAEGLSFDDVGNDLKKALGWSLNIYDDKDDVGDRMSVLLGFDMLTRRGKIYALAESGDDMGLITVSISEK